MEHKDKEQFLKFGNDAMTNLAMMLNILRQTEYEKRTPELHCYVTMLDTAKELILRVQVSVRASSNSKVVL